MFSDISVSISKLIIRQMCSKSFYSVNFLHVHVSYFSMAKKPNFNMLIAQYGLLEDYQTDGLNALYSLLYIKLINYVFLFSKLTTYTEVSHTFAEAQRWTCISVEISDRYNELGPTFICSKWFHVLVIHAKALCHHHESSGTGKIEKILFSVDLIIVIVKP